MRKREVITPIAVTILLFILTISATILIEKHPESALILQWIYYPLVAGVVLFTVKVVEKKKLSSIGIIRKNFFKNILGGLLAFSALSLFEFVPLIFSGDTSVTLPYNVHTVPQALLQSFFEIFFVAVAEEIAFRGYLLERLSTVFPNPSIAALISSILFGLWHYPASNDMMQVLSAFIFGLAFCLLRMRQKDHSLVPVTVAHGLLNTLTVWLSFFFA